MRGMLIFAFLFLAGVILNLVDQDFANALYGLIISGALFALYLFLKRQSRKSDEFTSWLFYNRDKILREGASYGDAFVDERTEITQFYICLSFLVFTSKIPTRLYIKDYDNTIIISVFCSSLTIIGGWWGLPWGPIYTIQVLTQNMIGGKKRTVSDFFSKADEHDEKIRQQYALGKN